MAEEIGSIEHCKQVRKKKKKRAVKSKKRIVEEVEEEGLDEEYAPQPGPVPPLLLDKSIYFLHPRVTRWRKADLGGIQSFEDRIGGKVVHQYAKLEESEAILQKVFHNLRGVEIIASQPDNSRYFFETERGLSAFATLVFGSDTYKGVVEIGIGKLSGTDKKVVFHLYFNSDRKANVLEFFKSTDRTDRLTDVELGEQDGGEEDDWINPLGYDISRSRDRRYRIEYESKVLYIEPLW